MRLSIVELGTVAPGTDERQALVDAVETARHAEAWGFHRVWFAEHHLSRSGASHHPELLIAAVGARTSTIRIGSGTVLMNHYSPFKVAEMFAQLETMYPGRVDLGMGRATAGPVIDMALRRDRRAPAQDDHTQQVAETLAWLYDAFPAGHPFAGNPLIPSVPGVPQTWLLGSSPSGSNLAAGLGIGYAFAGFINPAGAAAALRHYREQFRPRGFGLAQGFGPAEPRSILAVNVTVAETEAQARRLVGSAKGFYARLRRQGGNAVLPSADEAAAELTDAEQEQPTRIVDGRWPQFVAGDVAGVRATLERMLAESRADELMVQNLIADPADRRRSHELLATMFDLRPATGVAPAARIPT
ncbi:MsnO8 family LLM class oxidoreductase [Frankia gtarii]|uniref:MsnO8 family LLM class oxidoreductase n=1 Tax=Frankia gtarii TaxID=2950102 RepID=UPI0021C06EAD|nr:MsnO8 family LLM class oxidoreductase [Frankia gtarii]